MSARKLQLHSPAGAAPASTFPVELWVAIVRLVRLKSRRAMLNLRAVSHAFKSLIDPILFERVTLQSTQGAIDFLKLITSVDISSSNSSSSTDLSPPTPNPAFAPPSQLQLQLQLHALYPPQSPLITPRNAGRWSLARHVDALCIAHGPPEVVAQIVARCVNTRSLAVWGWMENLPELWVRVAEEAHIGVGQNMGRGGDDDRCIFQPIRLQRLSVDVRSLWTRRVVSERPQFKSGTVNHMGVVPLPFRQTSRTILKTAVGGDAEEEEEDVEWSDEWSISSKGEIEVIDGEEGRIFDEMDGQQSTSEQSDSSSSSSTESSSDTTSDSDGDSGDGIDEAGALVGAQHLGVPQNHNIPVLKFDSRSPASIFKDYAFHPWSALFLRSVTHLDITTHLQEGLFKLSECIYSLPELTHLSTRATPADWQIENVIKDLVEAVHVPATHGEPATNVGPNVACREGEIRNAEMQETSSTPSWKYESKLRVLLLWTDNTAGKIVDQLEAYLGLVPPQTASEWAKETEEQRWRRWRGSIVIFCERGEPLELYNRTISPAERKREMDAYGGILVVPDMRQIWWEWGYRGAGWGRGLEGPRRGQEEPEKRIPRNLKETWVQAEAVVDKRRRFLEAEFLAFPPGRMA